MVCFVSKMKNILLFFLIFFQLTSINPAYAFEIDERNEYLFDVRNDDGNIYLNRLSLNKKLDSYAIEISLFGEVQWNFDTDEWEKLELGIEATKSLWKYLYIDQSLQLVSGQILDYMVFDTDSKSIDATTKIGLNLPFLKYFSLGLFEEYSFNLEKGRDEYNEVGAEISFNPKDSFTVGIGWRHTDRVHNFDSDYATLSLSLHF